MRFRRRKSRSSADIAEVEARFAKRHGQVGYTVIAYFPPEAPWSVVDKAIGEVADLCYSYSGAGGGEWDPFVVGVAGDVHGVDGDPDSRGTWIGYSFPNPKVHVSHVMTPRESRDFTRLLAQSGIDTPGCDCGHEEMGVKWHARDCAWRSGLEDEPPLAPESPGQPVPPEAG